MLLVTGELDPKVGYLWKGKERKSILARYLDASSRVANQELVKLILVQAYPADSSLSMFSIIRFNDSAIVAAQLCKNKQKTDPTILYEQYFSLS